MKGQIIDTLAPENVHAKTCTLMFTVALLVITKTLNWPRYPSIGEWLNWYMHTMKCLVFRNEKEGTVDKHNLSKSLRN